MTDNVTALINHFHKAYESKFNKRTFVNRNRIQNPVKNMLKDFTVPEIKELIDFYVKTSKDPKMLFLCFEYDEVAEQMQDYKKDLERRRALMEETQMRVEEFRRRYGAN